MWGDDMVLTLAKMNNEDPDTMRETLTEVFDKLIDLAIENYTGKPGDTMVKTMMMVCALGLQVPIMSLEESKRAMGAVVIREHVEESIRLAMGWHPGGGGRVH